MTGIEALQAMKDGKKVRNNHWKEGEYVYWNGKILDICDEKDERYNLKAAFLLETDNNWEIYEETVTLRELLGYTIRLSGRNYYVVPYVLQRMHLVEGSVPVVFLMPVDTISNPFSWMQFQITHKVPKSAILKIPTDNGIAILDGE